MQHARTALAILFLAGFAALGAAFPDDAARCADPFVWKVRIAPAAAVKGEKVLLGEIGEPVGEIDPEVWKILAATPLWSMPGRESQVNMPRGKVLEDLDRFFPGSTRNFVVPDQVCLRRGDVRPVPMVEVHKMVVEFLTRKFEHLEADVEVQEITLGQAMFLNPETEKLSLESAGQISPGRVSLRLTVSSLEGRVLRQTTLNAVANVWKVIPVAARPMAPRDGELGEDRVVFERRNLAYVHGQPWDGKGQAMRVRTVVNTGMPLTSENLEPMPLIVKGDQVTLVWSGRHIHLTMPVTAVTDGSRGGRITVRNVQSGKEIAAVVVDPKTVTAR